MKAGVVSRTDNQQALDIAQRVIDFLKAEGVEVSVETDTALALRYEDENTNLQDLDGDFIVTVGGDGTILRAAMEMKNSETPMFGVNKGRKGFLSEVSPDDVEVALKKVLEEDYILEECPKVASRCVGLEDSFPDALNEVLIASSLPSKMLLFRLSIDGQVITDIQADGIIVAGPAGSTAYNMSAGGSIMAPYLDALSLTAICPYSYFTSLVFPNSSTVTVELLKPKADGMVIVDGRAYKALKHGAVVEITSSQNRTKFIRFEPFYARVHRRITNIQNQ